VNGGRLRIGLVAACAFPAPRGSQVLIDQMATALAGAGAETHLIAPLADRALRRPYVLHAATLAARLRAPAPRIGLGSVARGLLDASLIAQLAAVVRRERLEVLHAHNYEGLIAALAVRRVQAVRVAFHSHNVLADELPTYARRGMRRWWRRLGSWCDRLLPRLADQVVALSPDVAGYLADAGVEPDRLTVIPPGLYPHPTTSLERGRRRRRAVFAGNLDGYQNLDLLLESWKLAVARDRDIRLALVTHASLRPLERKVRRAGLSDGVELVAARSLADVTRELASSMVGVSPRSSWSGFPIKTLNYMAASLPTVAIAGSAKGVAHRETGWIVSRPDAPALAAALLESLSDPETSATFGGAARQRHAELHSWDEIGPRVLEVSRRALG
jgi:glycosyltransferase involved in cell wall biosynthesis